VRNAFFEEKRQQSIIKTTIVAKYFRAWARVVSRPAKSHGNKIGYIDLFAGPGTYADGTKSTPIVILEMAIHDKDLSQMLVTVFNDASEDCCRSLSDAVFSMPGIGSLKHQPIINNAVVGKQIESIFSDMHLIPSLIFLDPWGYKGLTLTLFESFLKDWGCELIFFFNYNRINMGLTNPKVIEHMDAMFGTERADDLRLRLKDLPTDERELTIVNELTGALQLIGGKYVLPFTFKDSRGTKTSHHLIFAGKHVRGYEIMKEVMASSSAKEQGVPSFEYNPADERYPALFEYAQPLDDLSTVILQEFAGKRISMLEIYESHHIGKPYLKRNYKDALRILEKQRKIMADPPMKKRPTRNGQPTFADKVMVAFPEV
jgi:three-Cys-motif partner protein